MELNRLYDKQRELELFVQEKTGISAEEFKSVEMVDKRVFALKVELGELSNETAWFKYWKQSHVMDRGKVIEELADCIHFILSIGIYRNYCKFVHELNWQQWMKVPIEHLYRYVMESGIGSSGHWRNAFEHLICIGIKMDFTLDEILAAYDAKNTKNIERQRANY